MIDELIPGKLFLTGPPSHNPPPPPTTLQKRCSKEVDRPPHFETAPRALLWRSFCPTFPEEMLISYFYHWFQLKSSRLWPFTPVQTVDVPS